MYIPYNTKYEYHKSNFGAVRCGKETVFRIVMPREMSVSHAFLVIKRDGENPQYIPMLWDCMQSENEEWWKIGFTADEPGLFFYHFEFDSPNRHGIISRHDEGYGFFSEEIKDFQLTVYDGVFSSPKNYKGGIIYQIFPDRFCNSHSEKKNVPESRIIRNDWGGEPYWKPDEKGITKNNDFFGGDLKGIESKLDYLSSLGVSCIYLNPVFEASSNHRYDTGDYLKIDPLLGDEKDFVSLCKKAKAKGISVILDGVFSHTGDDSVYFNKYGNYDSVGAYQSEKSPYYDWYKFNSFNEDYECWWGVKILPEVNEENEKYLEFIAGENSVAKKWLKCGASGWRLDVADELPDVFLEKFRKSVKSEKEDAIIIGEVWEDASNKISYGKRRKYLLGNQLDSVMNYPFAEAIINFVRTGIAERFDKKIMTIVENYPKESLDLLFNHIGSHDTERLINALAGESLENKSREWQSGRKLDKNAYNFGLKLVPLAAAIQYMLPGVPSVYYGDEIGIEGYRDPFNRSCFDWDGGSKTLLEKYRLLGKIRRENSCFVDGKIIFLSSERRCVAFLRQGEKESIILIVNRNDEDIDYYLDERYRNGTVLYGSEGYDEKITVRGNDFAVIKIINKKSGSLSL